MRKAIIPLVATAAAQLLVIGSIAAAFAFQPKETQLPIAMIPVQADIEQGECIRRDPAPYEPITYRVPLDADLQQYTAEMCDLYEVPLELAYAVNMMDNDTWDHAGNSYSKQDMWSADLTFTYSF